MNIFYYHLITLISVFELNCLTHFEHIIRNLETKLVEKIKRGHSNYILIENRISEGPIIGSDQQILESLYRGSLNFFNGPPRISSGSFSDKQILDDLLIDYENFQKTLPKEMNELKLLKNMTQLDKENGIKYYTDYLRYHCTIRIPEPVVPGVNSWVVSGAPNFETLLTTYKNLFERDNTNYIKDIIRKFVARYKILESERNSTPFDDRFEKKYLKYKNKYLTLKKQLEGTV